MLRILQVVPVLGYGGVEKIVCRYFEHIDKSNFSFDFVSHGSYSPYHDDLTRQGCHIYYIQTLGQLGYKRYKKELKKINLSNYDIIHIHVGHLTGVYAAIYHSLCQAKIICHAHTTRCMSRGAFLMPLFRCLSRYYADKLLACGLEAGTFCFGKCNFDLLPNAIAFTPPLARDSEEVHGLRREFGISSDEFVVGHIGHFSSPKNHGFIVSIAQALAEIFPNFKLILVGDGPDRATIEQAVNNGGIAERVLFSGVRDDVPILMNLFDIFILPSLHEGIPLVGVEAQAAGTHCLISNTVDESVNMGAGLCEFLPITQGTKPWVDAILNIAYSPRNVSPEIIFQALCNNGYEITIAKNRLESLYKELIQHEVTE